jgi:soluble P-type ATPase
MSRESHRWAWSGDERDRPLTTRGVLIEGVEPRIDVARDAVGSADAFGTLDAIAERLRIGAMRAATDEDKLRVLNEGGHDRSAVIGNGANDVLVLEAAAVGF